MNLPLYQKALRHIEAHPEQWHQGEWCGTPCSIAGHVLLTANYDGFTNDYNTPLIAGRLLDLTEDEKDYIFCLSRTLKDFQNIEAYYLANPTGSEPYDSDIVSPPKDN